MTSFRYALLLLIGLLPTLAPAETVGVCPINRTISTLLHSASTLNPAVLKLALTAYNCAVVAGMDQQQVLTVIDYSLPSSEARLWVFDLIHHRLVFNSLVAHGRSSGETLATHFSDRPQTHETSLGLFLTGKTYQGHNGYSLKLSGLEKGFNDTAEVREIVIHGAVYVNNKLAQLGRLGRSWGCPAVPKDIAQPLIDEIKDGTLVFAYYPDRIWLKESRYLNCQA